MKKSSYLEPYLTENASRGWNRGLSVGTYLCYVLRGRALAQWKARYEAALRRSLEWAERQGLAVRGRSARGREAWYPTSVAPRENAANAA